MTVHSRASKHEFDLCKDGKFFEAVASNLTIYFGTVNGSCSLLFSLFVSLSTYMLIYLPSVYLCLPFSSSTYKLTSLTASCIYISISTGWLWIHLPLAHCLSSLGCNTLYFFYLCTECAVVCAGTLHGTLSVCLCAWRVCTVCVYN